METRHQPTQEPKHTYETEPKLKPQIYAACLAAYNNGHLHGDWIHADQEPDYLMAEIQDMLEKSPIPDAEEWAIHDYEGFAAFNLHEYERLETIARVAGGIATHGAPFSHWIREVGSDAEDAIETFTDHYRGTYETVADMAEEFLDDMGLNLDTTLPDWIRPYVTINLEALGNAIAADLITAEDQHGVHIFDQS